MEQLGGIKTEWGGIAADNLLKVSGNGPYKEMVQNFVKALMSVDETSGVEPKVIADLIQKAITAEQPATRYKQEIIWLM